MVSYSCTAGCANAYKSHVESEISILKNLCKFNHPVTRRKQSGDAMPRVVTVCDDTVHRKSAKIVLDLLYSPQEKEKVSLRGDGYAN